MNEPHHPSPNEEALEQSKRVSITAGAAALGAAVCFVMPVVGGLTLACVGAAAAAAATTRADETGEAARASGRAVAAGIEKVSRADIVGNACHLYTNAKERITNGPPPEKETKEEVGWWASTLAVLPWRREGAVQRLEIYGKAKSSVQAAAGLLDEISAGSTPEKRRRIAAEILREIDPTRARDSVSSRATAAALTRIAVAVRDYLDEVGWDAFDSKSNNALLADLKPRLDRL